MMGLLYVRATRMFYKWCVTTKIMVTVFCKHCKYERYDKCDLYILTISSTLEFCIYTVSIILHQANLIYCF